MSSGLWPSPDSCGSGGRNMEKNSPNVLELRLRLGLQLDVPVVEFDGEFDVLAAVLLADFLSLLLHEAVEGVEVAGDIFSRLLFSCHQSVVEALHLFVLA